MEKEQPSAAWKSGWFAAEAGRTASTNPYRGEPDKGDFNKGFYAWLMLTKQTLMQ